MRSDQTALLLQVGFPLFQYYSIVTNNRILQYSSTEFAIRGWFTIIYKFARLLDSLETKLEHLLSIVGSIQKQDTLHLIPKVYIFHYHLTKTDLTLFIDA